MMDFPATITILLMSTVASRDECVRWFLYVRVSMSLKEKKREGKEREDKRKQEEMKREEEASPQPSHCPRRLPWS